MVKDYSRVAFPVMLNMAPHAFLTNNCYPYQFTAGISHLAIPRMSKVIIDVPQNVRPTDSIEWHWGRGVGGTPRQLPGNRGTLSTATILLCVAPN
jgi:hypothetical protein